MLSISDISIRLAGRLLIDHGDGPDHARRARRPGRPQRHRQIDAVPRHPWRARRPKAATITIPPRWRVGSLAQEAPDGPESLVEIVLKADLERDALLREAETAHDPHRIAEIQTRLVDIDAHSAPGARRRDPERPRLLGRRSGAARARNSPAAGACAWRLPRRCSPHPICCCWTSRPTISISKARSGSRIIWRTIRAP